MLTELWKLPVPATTLLKDPQFNVLPRRQCEISLDVERSDGETLRIALLFEGVEAFKCTYLTSCTAEMFDKAYAKVVRLEATPWLNEVIKTYTSNNKLARELQHLMICFDDGPCFEIICLNFMQRAIK